MRGPERKHTDGPHESSLSRGDGVVHINAVKAETSLKTEGITSTETYASRESPELIPQGKTLVLLRMVLVSSMDSLLGIEIS